MSSPLVLNSSLALTGLSDSIVRDQIARDEIPTALTKQKLPLTLISPTRTYTLLNRIGEGTFSTVYRASGVMQSIEEGRAREIKGYYAIKISPPQFEDRQCEEEQMIAKLYNKAIPIIRGFEGFSQDQQRITAYELLYKDLQTFIKSQEFDRCNLQEVNTIALQLLTALEHFSFSHTIHADIKPANILLVERESLQIKVADFNIAHSQENRVVGKRIQTLKYRAPEIALGLDYNEKIDIWSAGCTLAELYTGNPLFLIEDHDSKQENQQLLIAIARRLGKIPAYLFKESRYNSDMSMCRRMPLTKGNLLDQFLFNGKNPLCKEEKDFLDLLTKMLEIDPNKRISATEALKHPFITSPMMQGQRQEAIENKEEEIIEAARPTAKRKASEYGPAPCLHPAVYGSPYHISMMQESTVRVLKQAMKALNAFATTQFNYTIIQKIGSGSHCTVYKAQCVTKRVGGQIIKHLECALKISFPDSRSRNVQINEERIIHRLQPTQHLPIISYLEGFNYDQHRVTAYPLFMHNLHDATQGPTFQRFSLSDTQNIGRQIVQGVAHLAARSIVHRDLKLSNIFVSKTDPSKIVLADFGFATDSQDNTPDVQTASYRAPEVALGLTYNEKIDMWSVGCIFVELYTGTKLFPLLHEDIDQQNKNLIFSIAGKIGFFPQSLLEKSLLFQLEPQATQTLMTFTEDCLGKILFQNQDLSTLDQEQSLLLDLVQKMLAIHPNVRISAQEALQHPFLAEVQGREAGELGGEERPES